MLTQLFKDKIKPAPAAHKSSQHSSVSGPNPEPDRLAGLLAGYLIDSLNDLQHSDEFIRLLTSSSEEIQREAIGLCDEIDSLKDRLQTLLL